MVHRRRKNIRQVDKPKLLFDEGLPRRQIFIYLNNYCSVKHIKHDYRMAGLSDDEIYKLANQDKRIIITFNIKDFRPKIINQSVSVIGIGANMENKQIDAKLTSWVKKCKPQDWYGKYIPIT